MPSWITHLATANKLCEKINIEDKNSFLFGNVMPDILNNYIVKETKEHKEYEITHFTDALTINGITYPFPNPNKFFEKYKDKMNNFVVYGFYVHLLTDYYWNKLSYQNHFENKDGLVEVKFSDGICENFEYNSAIKIKQQDFKIFTEYLKETYTTDKITYSDNLLELSREIIQTPLTKEDIEKTIIAVDEHLKNKIDLSERKYKLFTQDNLNTYFDESIDWIIEQLSK